VAQAQFLCPCVVLRGLCAFRQEVQKAWAIGDTAKEKETAAQQVILKLKEEVLNLRTQMQDLNRLAACAGVQRSEGDTQHN